MTRVVNASCLILTQLRRNIIFYVEPANPRKGLAGKAIAGKALAGRALAGKALAGKALAGKALAGKALAGKALTSRQGRPSPERTYRAYLFWRR